jgi:hypothetical protein
MKKSLHRIGRAIALVTLAWSSGCGEAEKPAAPPEQTEQLRQQQIERSQRMQKEA